MRENGTQLQRHIGGLVVIALHDGLSHRPGLCTGQQDQAFGQLLEPIDFDDGNALEDVLRPGAGQQLANIEVALVALHQQNHAGQCTRITAQTFKVDFSAQDGLDALASTFLVKLDATEQVVQIGDGQGRLPVFGGHFDHIVDAASGVNN